MKTSWYVYVLDREGKEVHLCKCEEPYALAEVIKSLAALGINGPAGYRVIRLEEDHAD